MADPLTVVPPGFVVAGLALVVAVLSRRAGHAVAVAGTVGVVGWTAAVPAGSHLPTRLFGFEAVLFHVDPFSRSVGVAFAFITAAGVAYGYTSDADRRQSAYAVAHAATGLGAVFAGDWLTLVVFWELMAVTATALVWHTAGRAPGIRYGIYHEIGGLSLMAGVLLQFRVTGTFVFGGGITDGLPAVLVALGIGLNAGFLALHVWMVDVYPRTHVAASVVLVAFSTKVGAFALLRAFPDGQVAVAYVGGAMVLFGVTMAILQTNMRRLLSYHVVSQVGYMVAGAGAGTELARAGATAHLVNNVLYKCLLFMVAGVVIARTGEETLEKLGGLRREMPLTALVFAVAALSIAAVPGFNGFVSKGMVVDGVGAADLDMLWWMLVVGAVGTVLSFTKFGYYAFLHGDDSPAVRDLTSLESATLGVVALACVVLGLVPGIQLGVFLDPVASAAKPFAAAQFEKAGAAVVAGLVGFAVVRAPLARVPPVPDLDSVYTPVGRWTIRVLAGSADRLDGWIEQADAAAGDRLLTILSGRPTAEPDPASGRRSAQDRSWSEIGTGVLLLSVVLALLLAVLLL